MLLALSLFLTGKGAWDFANGLMDLRKEKYRQAELAAAGLEEEETMAAIRKSILTGGLMGFAGIWGLFIFVSRTTRKHTNHSIISKTKKTNELHR